jgi:hypothetical protein
VSRTCVVTGETQRRSRSHADYTRQASEALAQVRQLKEVIQNAPSDAVRNAIGGLIEKVGLHFDQGPARRNGYRPASLISLEAQVREQVAALLGDQLRRVPQNTA